MTQTTPITVIGGGLAGLVAAITAAEAGAPVELHEAHPMLGGRAATTQGAYKANLGPHAVYADGPLWAWLRDRGLHKPFVRPSLTGLTFRDNGELRRTPPLGAFRAVRRLGDAPVDVSFRAWMAERAGDEVARQLSNFAGVATFTADPGSLSAAFVAERVRRATKVPPAARFITGGWGTLIDRLGAHARAAGVEIHLGSRVDDLPDGPVVLAVELAQAAKLLGDPGLAWPGARTVLLDVAIDARRGDAWVISDLDEAGWVERFSKQDPTLCPTGQSLIQAQLGLHDGETLDDGVARLERLIDLGFPGWRDRERWRRRSVVENRSGAIDYPGSTWRDRPAVDQGSGRYLCGDMVAAPGLLSEVSWASAVLAADAAVSRSSSAPVRRLG